MAGIKKKEVKVLYTFLDRRLLGQAWERHMRKLPEEARAKVMSYRRWQDRQAAVLGKMLVMEGLEAYGYTPDVLSRICLDAYGRPLIDDLVDFNLSHSGEYVVCAVSGGTRVGIDIEKRKGFCFSELVDCFTADEKEELMKSENTEAIFYDFWTMKESVLKADGRGLSVPMDQVIVRNGHVKLDGTTWFLKGLDFGPDYSCHLAVNAECASIEMKKVEFSE